MAGHHKPYLFSPCSRFFSTCYEMGTMQSAFGIYLTKSSQLPHEEGIIIFSFQMRNTHHSTTTLGPHLPLQPLVLLSLK